MNTAAIDTFVRLFNIGIGGVMLLWFMFKYEPRQRELEHSVQLLTRAVLLLIAGLTTSEDSRKVQRDQLEKELQESERKAKP